MLILSEKFGFEYPDIVVNFILPIGLSFHTFQSLSYVIEVYRGNQKPEKHFGIYSLYVMFYPQLVTGPIERPQNLLVQLREKIGFKYENISHGLRLVLFGLFIKMVIADNLATYVDQVYSNPTIFSSLTIIKAMFFYSFQIYCDFFGYSTIAVGCARVMGYDLMDNFKNPYLSSSIGEFWQRWHISLSSWFRDYVYFSLGGNRVKVYRWMLNILIIFLLSGLWHGANWTFILWGFAHGLVYLIESVFSRYIKIKTPDNKVVVYTLKTLNIIKTFTLVSLIWILFRATDMEQAEAIFRALFSNFDIIDDFTVEPKVWLFLLFFIVIDSLLFKSRFDRWCDKRNIFVRWSLYLIMIFLIIVFSSVENFPFIYFQF